MIRLVMTCRACPELYDAFDGDRKVGYLRLRHGRFSVRCPDGEGYEVYSATPAGDGIFDSKEERNYYLRWAVYHIEKWIIEGPPKIGAAPDVKYVVEEMADDDWTDWGDA